MPAKKKTKKKAVARAPANPVFQRYIAVDPGRSGAVAVLDAGGQLIRLHDAKSENALATEVLAQVIREESVHGSVAFAVERPLAFRVDNGASLITLSLASGAAFGVAAALGAWVEFPSASVWKRKLGVTSDKGTSKSRARELFGDALPKVCRDDKAEAALIAFWLYTKYHNDGCTK
jgi:hypothetical protein